MRIITILVLTATLVACQTRQAQLVPLSQPGDASLKCAEIIGLMADNRAKAAKLAKIDEGIAAGNTIAVAVSRTLFWPAVLAVDLSDVEQIEMRSLVDRNQRLGEIAKKKGCIEVSPNPQQPKK